MHLSARIGARIREARARKALSQSDLARAVQKSRQHISQLEQGKQSPRVELLLAMADALEVTTDFLLDRSRAAIPPAPAPRRARAAQAPPAPPTLTVVPRPDPPARKCPRCRMTMHPLGDGARVSCSGCHYTMADET